MHEDRNVQRFVFAGSGTQTISVPAGHHATIKQMDISVPSDTTYEIKQGTEYLSDGNVFATGSPLQLYFFDHGKGRGTGEMAADIHVTLNDAGVVYLVYSLWSAAD